MTLQQQIRAQRNALLTVVADILQRHLLQVSFELPCSYNAAQIKQVASYAQALRDVPQQTDFPKHVRWPTPPMCLRDIIIE